MDCIVCTIDGDDSSLREMTNLTSRCSKGHFGYLLRILTLVDEKMSVEKTQIYFCRNWCAS